MAKRIGVLEANQAATESPRLFEKKSKVKAWIRRLEAVWIVEGHLAQKLVIKARKLADQARGFWDGPLGFGNALPFSKPTDPKHHAHYEIPMAGDRGAFARHRRKLIRVSARSRSHLSAVVAPTTLIAARLLAAS